MRLPRNDSNVYGGDGKVRKNQSRWKRSFRVCERFTDNLSHFHTSCFVPDLSVGRGQREKWTGSSGYFLKSNGASNLQTVKKLTHHSL